MSPTLNSIHNLASIDLSLEGKAAELVRFEAMETLGQLFRFTADVVFQCKPNDNLRIGNCLGRMAAITITQSNAPSRYFHGMIVAAEFLNETASGKSARLIMMPHLYMFAQNKQYRVYEEMTAPDILIALLGECGLSFTKKLSRTYAKRGYTTQFGESHFAFMSRLMEDEGIYYYFQHTETGHAMVLCDAPSSHATGTPAVLEYNPTARNLNTGDFDHALDRYVHTWTQNVTAHGQKSFVLWDNLFAATGNNMAVTSPFQRSDADTKFPDFTEFYDFEGSYELHQPAGGEERAAQLSEHVTHLNARATIRREIIEARRKMYTGIALSPLLACGHKFTLDKQPNYNHANEYLLVSVRTVVYGPAFETTDGTAADSQTEIEAILSSYVWRSQQVTPKPIAHGPQTAIVVGPPGEEIFTDKYGRVKVQFPWDRYGKNDNHSSAWLRVSQTGGIGNIIMPRVGHEVLVGFLNGDPDRPIVTGRLFSNTNMPAYTLPDHKTRAVWRTKTYGVPHGKSAKEALGEDSLPLEDVSDTDGNELRFEDKYGQEEVMLLAHRDMNTRIRFNETHHVGRDQETKVFHDSIRHVENNSTINIGKDAKLTIGQHNTEEIKGNEKRTIIGTSTVDITANHTVTLKADASYTTKGKNTVKVDGDDKQDYGGKSDVKIAQSLTIDAGQKILLSVGSNSIEISPSGIKINGVTLKMEATGPAELSGALTTVKASGILTAQGSLVKIN